MRTGGSVLSGGVNIHVREGDPRKGGKWGRATQKAGRLVFIFLRSTGFCGRAWVKYPGKVSRLRWRDVSLRFT